MEITRSTLKCSILCGYLSTKPSRQRYICSTCTSVILRVVIGVGNSLSRYIIFASNTDQSVCIPISLLYLSYFYPLQHRPRHVQGHLPCSTPGKQRQEKSLDCHPRQGCVGVCYSQLGSYLKTVYDVTKFVDEVPHIF